MPGFRYSAISATGDVVSGMVEAPTEAAAIAAIQRLGHIPLHARPADGALAWRPTLSLGRRTHLTRQDTANITRELAIMLSAGQDLDRALRFLVDTAPNARIRRVMEEVRAVVRDGASLASALARQPRSFSRLYIGLVRAGEAGGALAEALERLALLLERERSLNAQVTSALIYPALLTIAAVGAIALLLTQVLPEFVPLFEQNGVALPQATQLLIGLGDIVSRYGLYALLALVLLALAVRQALARPATRLRADRLILRLPIAGALTREALAARFSRTLGTLLMNGMPLIPALEVVRDVLGNRAAVAAVADAAETARNGGGLSASLAAAATFPVRTVYLLRLGEETAQLGAMALRAAEIHEENTRLGVQRLIALLVPAITLVMGAAVAAIVTALLLAMLSLNDLAT
ncbi:MAG: type II secretion system F family protein [Alphaproteobacteria bacterium]|nr:type II secretion system F family protein [Alphaproteobacteria bacterium]